MGKVVKLGVEHQAVVVPSSQLKPRLAQGDSPLTPELKEFIDHAIVPALVREYLAMCGAENSLAPKDPDAAHSESSTVPKLRTMRL